MIGIHVDGGFRVFSGANDRGYTAALEHHKSHPATRRKVLTEARRMWGANLVGWFAGWNRGTNDCRMGIEVREDTKAQAIAWDVRDTAMFYKDIAAKHGVHISRVTAVARQFGVTRKRRKRKR
jgi:hypothetical protein